MFVDSHCHLDKLDLAPYNNDLDAAVQAALDHRVSHMLCIGVDLESADQVVALAERYDQVYASVGTHPLYGDRRAPTVEELLSIARHPRVVGIGETGLDYYYSKDNPRIQAERFITHIEAAVQTELPLIVHTREAKQDTLDLLRQYGQNRVRGVLHCFTEDLDMARQAIDLGFCISISGIVTFRNAESLREVVRAVPIDHLLIETDAPWLAPVPYRGKKNEPKYVGVVAEKVAELKGISVEDVAEQTTRNFFSLFTKACTGAS